MPFSELLETKSDWSTSLICSAWCNSLPLAKLRITASTFFLKLSFGSVWSSCPFAHRLRLPAVVAASTFLTLMFQDSAWISKSWCSFGFWPSSFAPFAISRPIASVCSFPVSHTCCYSKQIATGGPRLSGFNHWRLLTYSDHCHRPSRALPCHSRNQERFSLIPWFPLYGSVPAYSNPPTQSLSFSLSVIQLLSYYYPEDCKHQYTTAKTQCIYLSPYSSQIALLS